MTNFVQLPYDGGTGREVSSVVNNILDGKINSTGTVTLTSSSSTTTVTDARVGSDSIILLMPTTSNASAEQGNGTIFVSQRNKQSFVLTHANNRQNDRTYGYIVIG